MAKQAISGLYSALLPRPVKDHIRKLIDHLERLLGMLRPLV